MIDLIDFMWLALSKNVKIIINFMKHRTGFDF